MSIHKYIIILALSVSTPAIAGEDMSVDESAYSPSAEEMILDGLIYRPLYLAGTLIGTGIYLVTLPFSLIGGNAGEAGQRLVIEPANYTFGPCLGCLPGYHNNYYHD